MAKLREYVPDSAQSGYYLRGFSSGSNTTLQVSRLATQILKWIEVSPGERVPEDLLWRFYDLGLIYTHSNEGTDITEPEFESAFADSEKAGGLSKDQKTSLRQFIDDYDSQRAEIVRQLEDLVDGVAYEEHNRGSTRFGGQNPLSDIAEKTHTREMQLERAEVILDRYSVEEREFIRDLPTPVLTAIHDFSEGYFDLIQVNHAESTLVYTFYDDEMWNGEEMVETNWKLWDVRKKSVNHDFEAEFDVEAHYTGSNVQTQMHIINGAPETFKLTTNWEKENVDLVHNSPIESRYEGFHNHICDCLHRQLRALPEYSYSGPGPFFEP